MAADQAVGPLFPAPLASLDRNPPAGTVTIAFAGTDLVSPYTQQTDFSIEPQITRDMGITVSYLFNWALKSMTMRGASYRVYVIDAETEAGDVKIVRSYASR